MAIFSRNGKIIEADGTPMTVLTLWLKSIERLISISMNKKVISILKVDSVLISSLNLRTTP